MHARDPCAGVYSLHTFSENCLFAACKFLSVMSSSGSSLWRFSGLRDVIVIASWMSTVSTIEMIASLDTAVEFIHVGRVDDFAAFERAACTVSSSYSVCLHL